MAVFEDKHFVVVLLEESDKSDPEYNYGVLNKEHSVFDVQTASEAAAIMLCQQHSYEKERRLQEVQQASSADNIVSIKPKGVH